MEEFAGISNILTAKDLTYIQAFDFQLSVSFVSENCM